LEPLRRERRQRGLEAGDVGIGVLVGGGGVDSIIAAGMFHDDLRDVGTTAVVVLGAVDPRRERAVGNLAGVDGGTDCVVDEGNAEIVRENALVIPIVADRRQATCVGHQNAIVGVGFLHRSVSIHRRQSARESGADAHQEATEGDTDNADTSGALSAVGMVVVFHDI
jgi:hypothetical protein